jgi:hypothetical protein
MITPEMQFLIPFLFVLAVVFGAIELSGIFKSRAVTAVIAIAIAAFAASYGPFVATLWTWLPSITWFFIIMFLIGFVMRALGLRGAAPGEAAEKMIIGGVVLFILLSVGWTVLRVVPIRIPFVAAESFILLLGLICIIVIFWLAIRITPTKGG